MQVPASKQVVRRVLPASVKPTFEQSHTASTKMEETLTPRQQGKKVTQKLASLNLSSTYRYKLGGLYSSFFIID